MGLVHAWHHFQQSIHTYLVYFCWKKNSPKKNSSIGKKIVAMAPSSGETNGFQSFPEGCEGVFHSCLTGLVVENTEVRIWWFGTAIEHRRVFKRSLGKASWFGTGWVCCWHVTLEVTWGWCFVFFVDGYQWCFGACLASPRKPFATSLGEDWCDNDLHLDHLWSLECCHRVADMLATKNL